MGAGSMAYRCASLASARYYNTSYAALTRNPLQELRASNLHHRLDARQRGDQVAEFGAADLEVAVLIERGAGRRQQHHGINQPRRLGIARGTGHRCIERPGNLVRHALAERTRKFLCRLADQVGFADARKVFGKAGDAAELWLAAGDPENVGEGRQRMRRSIGIGALGIVDEQYTAATADLLHAMR